MAFVFFKDGTFKKTKLSKAYKKDVEFYLVDISTARKGPLYTMVKNPINKIPYDDFNIDLFITIGPVDLPFNDTTDVKSTDVIDTIEKYYGIYPLINQMFSINTFIYNNWRYFDNYFEIYQIDFAYNNKFVSLTSNASEKKIKKTFKHLGMLTDVESIMGDIEVILLNKNKWKFIDTEVDHISDIKSLKFDGVLIKLPSMESVYYVTKEELLRLINIKTLTITMNYEAECDECDSEECENVEVYTMYDILYACIFIPQLILVYNTLSSEFVSFRVDIETKKDKLYRLIVGNKSTNVPEYTCIFDIISNLLKIQPYHK